MPTTNLFSISFYPIPQHNITSLLHYKSDCRFYQTINNTTYLLTLISSRHQLNKFTMVSFGLSSVLAAIISAAPLVAALPASEYGPSPINEFTPFNLVTVTKGNASYNNLYIAPQHSGAARNYAMAFPSSTPGRNFSKGAYVLNK